MDDKQIQKKIETAEIWFWKKNLKYHGLQRHDERTMVKQLAREIEYENGRLHSLDI